MYICKYIHIYKCTYNIHISVTHTDTPCNCLFSEGEKRRRLSLVTETPLKYKGVVGSIGNSRIYAL